MRLHQRIGRDFAPYREECVAEPLAGEVVAGLAQRPGILEAFVAVAAGRFPGDHRDQDRALGAGQALGVAQCLQAAW